jgi:hypothetical protein
MVATGGPAPSLTAPHRSAPRDPRSDLRDLLQRRRHPALIAGRLAGPLSMAQLFTGYVILTAAATVIAVLAYPEISHQTGHPCNLDPDALTDIAATDDLHIAPFREDGTPYETPTSMAGCVISIDLG